MTLPEQEPAVECIKDIDRRRTKSYGNSNFSSSGSPLCWPSMPRVPSASNGQLRQWQNATCHIVRQNHDRAMANAGNSWRMPTLRALLAGWPTLRNDSAAW